ncbi:MAG: hypothetical protein HYZ48_02095 [Chlamydiales bacterium]|nr:hypothetical protein [Chlamydiales bacterium]
MKILTPLLLAFAFTAHIPASAQEEEVELPLQLQSGISFFKQDPLKATYQRMNFHWLAYVSEKGRLLQLEDGSYWEVTSSDRYVLNYWEMEDQLVITPNYNLFSPGDYFITNKTDNTYVRANLHTGPEMFGPHSHWIIAIDHTSGHITLENGTTWCVYSNDQRIFSDWEVNDHIIIGLYDNWLHTFDHTLINANMGSCALGIIIALGASLSLGLLPGLSIGILVTLSLLVIQKIGNYLLANPHNHNLDNGGDRGYIPPPPSRWNQWRQIVTPIYNRAPEPFRRDSSPRGENIRVGGGHDQHAVPRYQRPEPVRRDPLPEGGNIRVGGGHNQRAVPRHQVPEPVRRD